jgi:hypothetical protein
LLDKFKILPFRRQFCLCGGYTLIVAKRIKSKEFSEVEDVRKITRKTDYCFSGQAVEKFSTAYYFIQIF